MLRSAAALLLGAVILLTGQRELPTGYYRVSGSDILSPAGEKTTLRGMGFGNNFWGNSLENIGLHHNEDSFREMAELGFNSVRFLLNYRWFEDDGAPYVYKQEGFDHLDQSIAWAKKYGIGLVFNMHIPQGGYQSQGNGGALWTDPENQSRLAALWGEIARRYSDEPAVIGYGIVNEPIVPELDTAEDTVEQCRELVQRCTDEIRKYDRNHIIFAERTAAVMDMSTGKSLWNKYEPEQLWYTLDDANVVYETHFYGPHSFTHQSAGEDITYPDPPYITGYESYWEGCFSAEQTGSTDYFETQRFSAGENYNLFLPSLHVNGIEDGTAVFEDIAVTEYSPDGSSRVIWENDFSSGCELPENEWSSDGSGNWSLSGGSIRMTGEQGDHVLTFRAVPIQEGCTYRVSGHMQKLISSGVADIRADLSRAKNVYYSGREYIYESLTAATAFGKEQGVPIYLGEFGADAASFAQDLGGERWVADVMDFCLENGISFSYHAYHEPMFGFYPEGINNYPQNVNQKLKSVFMEKLQ